MFGRDTDTRISDGKDYEARLIFNSYGNAAILTVILNRIVAEIIDDTLQSLWYTSDYNGFSVKRHRNMFLFRRC